MTRRAHSYRVSLGYLDMQGRRFNQQKTQPSVEENRGRLCFDRLRLTFSRSDCGRSCSIRVDSLNDRARLIRTLYDLLASPLLYLPFGHSRQRGGSAVRWCKALFS